MKAFTKKVLGAAVVMLSAPAIALAIDAPNSGALAYDIYDIAVNDLLKGPIGFVAGTAAILFGAVSAIRAQIMMAVPAILGGAFMLQADSVVETLGALIF